MIETEIEDKSLLKCTIKKSADVLKKVVLYGSYVITAITAIVIIYFGITMIWEPLVKIISGGITTIWLILTPIGIFLLMIPWYVYVGGVAVLAIPVYSLLWCIARELTDEDWKSDSAKNITVLALALAFAVITLAIAITLAAIVLTLALAFAVITLAAIVLALASNSKLFSFPGAYLHYRKRIQCQEKKE